MSSVEQVRFSVGAVDCVGQFRTPDGAGPFALVILAHGLGGTVAMGLTPYAEHFTAAGYATLAFDYRSFGQSDGTPRQVIDLGRQREDWSAAIAYGKSRPDVDASRVAIWGSSLAGGHVLTIAAGRSDLAAAIAQCPFTDGVASSLALGPVSTAKVGVRAIGDVASMFMKRGPVYVEAAGTPRSAALMTSPDAYPGFLNLISNAKGGQHDTRVAARFGLAIGLDRPGKKLGAITTPTLVQVCNHDSVAPDKATMRHLNRANNASITVERVDGGHFDVYDGPVFDAVVAGQLAHLQKHVPA